MNKLLTWYYLYWKALSVMRPIWDKMTVEGQGQKFVEERKELTAANKQSKVEEKFLKGGLKFSDITFMKFYKIFVKDTEQEEKADVYISWLGL